MAYIYVKTVNEKKYYYLRISKRLNGQVITKDIAYLGDDISQLEQKLDKLNKYQNEIRSGYKNIKRFLQFSHYLKKIKDKKLKKTEFLNSDLFEEIEAIRLHYSDKVLKLDKKSLHELYLHFLVDFAFNTTSIEGNTITLKQAKMLLYDNLLPKDKTLREVYDLQNTEKVFFELLENKPNISERTIIKIHNDLLDKIDDRKGYRTHDIRVLGANFEATPVKYISIDMKLLFEFYEKNKKTVHPLALAGIMHHKLEKIHPFADGNGRTGRMLLNYILIANGYPLIIIPMKKRNKYLSELKKADSADLSNKDIKIYKNLIDYLGTQLINSYWNNFNV